MAPWPHDPPLLLTGHLPKEINDHPNHQVALMPRPPFNDGDLVEYVVSGIARLNFYPNDNCEIELLDGEGDTLLTVMYCEDDEYRILRQHWQYGDVVLCTDLGEPGDSDPCRMLLVKYNVNAAQEWLCAACPDDFRNVGLTFTEGSINEWNPVLIARAGENLGGEADQPELPHLIHGMPLYEQANLQERVIARGTGQVEVEQDPAGPPEDQPREGGQAEGEAPGRREGGRKPQQGASRRK